MWLKNLLNSGGDKNITRTRYNRVVDEGGGGDVKEPSRRNGKVGEIQPWTISLLFWNVLQQPGVPA